MKQFYMGIDPGIKGAVALILDNGQTAMPEFIVSATLPTLMNSDRRKIIDIPELIKKLGGYFLAYDIIVGIEKQWMRGGTGARGGYTAGMNYGRLLGWIESSAAPFVEINPDVWKVSLHVPADKAGAVAKCYQLFPETRDCIQPNQDGMAEAVLIAYHTFRRFTRNARAK